jgi:hypothetical protein
VYRLADVFGGQDHPRVLNTIDRVNNALSLSGEASSSSSEDEEEVASSSRAGGRGRGRGRGRGQRKPPGGRPTPTSRSTPKPRPKPRSPTPPPFHAQGFREGIIQAVISAGEEVLPVVLPPPPPRPAGRGNRIVPPPAVEEAKPARVPAPAIPLHFVGDHVDVSMPGMGGSPDTQVFRKAVVASVTLRSNAVDLVAYDLLLDVHPVTSVEEVNAIVAGVVRGRGGVRGRVCAGGCCCVCW